MKGSLKCLGQPNQAAYADTEIKLDAVTEPEPLQGDNIAHMFHEVTEQIELCRGKRHLLVTDSQFKGLQVKCEQTNLKKMPRFCRGCWLFRGKQGSHPMPQFLNVKWFGELASKSSPEHKSIAPRSSHRPARVEQEDRDVP